MKEMSKILIAFALTGLVLGCTTTGEPMQAMPNEKPQPVIRIAELRIDPAHLDAYKAALTEEVEMSVRLEPGVLALNAVSVSDDPTQIRLLEVYANQSAYEAHLQSPHFIKYKVTTEKMVKELRLVPTTPIKLCSKAGLSQDGAAICM